MENSKDIDECYYALKYPDYHTWRDLEAALARGGYWPDNQPVRLSDPEMKPRIDRLREKIKSSPMFAKELLTKINTGSA